MVKAEGQPGRAPGVKENPNLFLGKRGARWKTWVPVLFLYTTRALISAGPRSSPHFGQRLWPDRHGALAAKTWKHRVLGSLAASWQLPPVQGRGLKDEGGIPEGAGEGFHGERGEANEVGILTKFAPGRLWRRLGLPRTAGGHRATWGTGGAVSSRRLPGAFLEPLGWETGGGQAAEPRASAPPWRRHGGPERGVEERAFAGTAESRITGCPPLRRSVWVGPSSLASVPRRP